MRDDETNTGSGDEWTAEEAGAFAALPREAPASDLLAERTVQALRAEGLVHVAPGRRAIRVTPLRVLGALAACLVLFVGGFAIGRRSPTTGAAPLEQHAAQYLAALDAAAHVTDPAASAAARTVARATLQAAAESMLRLYPDDAFAARILQAQDVADATKTSTGAATHQRIVWF